MCVVFDDWSYELFLLVFLLYFLECVYDYYRLYYLRVGVVNKLCVYEFGGYDLFLNVDVNVYVYGNVLLYGNGLWYVCLLGRLILKYVWLSDG